MRGLDGSGSLPDITAATNPVEGVAVEKSTGGSLSGDTSAVSCCFLRLDFESVSGSGFFFTSLSVQCEGVLEYLLPLHSSLVFLQHFFLSQAGFWDHVCLLHEQLLRWTNTFRQIGRRALITGV